MWHLARAIELLRNDGVLTLGKKIPRYTKKKTKKVAQQSFIIPYERQYYQRRADNEARWSFIRPHIAQEKTCLDIGCAQGYFTKKAAEEGLLTLGIDNNEAGLSYAQKNGGSNLI